MYASNNKMSYQGDESHCSADPSQHNSTTIMDIFYNAWGSLRPTPEFRKALFFISMLIRNILENRQVSRNI